MDKISSIIPTNNRVRAVDLEDSQPIRPGTPAFGRPVGSTSSYREKLREQAHDRAIFSDEAKEASKQTADTAPVKSKEKTDPGAKIIGQITKGFGDTKPKVAAAPAEAEAEPVQLSSMAQSFENENLPSRAVSSPATGASFLTAATPESYQALNKYA